MKRYFFASLISFGAPTLILWFVLPIQSMQVLLWLSAFIFFIIGDSVTTSLVHRYDKLEETGPATRQLCGQNPSPLCAFGTRILFFSVSLLAYLLVTHGRVGAQFEMITLTAVLLPLVLTVAGVAVVLNNSYHILTQERANRLDAT